MVQNFYGSRYVTTKKKYIYIVDLIRKRLNGRKK